MALEPGTRLGAHEILGLLGAGGMGEVYRATDTRLKRDVAIKVLPEAFAADPDRVARFQREAELLASLNHPNVAAIYGLEQLDPSTRSGRAAVAIVLEFVDGETLADVIARGPLTIADALPIARQVCEALEAAHDKGVVHRDLKPANIKIAPDGRVKVLDFGLAKMLESDPKSAAMSMSPTLSVHATYAGVILGTAAYMSPEQARGKAVDRRTDVWAFGCVLYEMLTGKHAFEPGETVSDAIASVLTREPDLGTIPADTPPAIRRLLRRCLQKDPQHRLPHIGAARLEIEDARIGSPEELIVATMPIAPAAVAVSRWRRALPMAASAVAVLASAYAAWTLKPEPARLVTRFAISLPEGQTFTNAGRQIVTLSPDGANLVYVANTRLYLRSMSTLETHAIAGSDVEAGLLNPVFSPDGQSVAFFSRADGTLKWLAVSGGTPVTICAATDPFGMSWADDGIVFGQAGKGILRVPAGGGTPQVVAAVGPGEMTSSPQMLPGGKAVLYSVKKPADAWDKAQIVVQALDNGARKVLVNGGADGRYVPSGHLVYAVEGVLLAVPFDPGRLEISGAPVPIVEGVRRAGTAGSTTGGAHFSYSRTGALVYVPGPAKLASAGADRDLALFDRKGGMQPLKLPLDAYSSPRVSPDGKAVAFDTEDDKEAIVWVYELGGASARRRLTFGGKNRWPVWSPDGRWIAFQSDREGDLAIFRQRADGSGTAERLTKPEAGSSHSPQSWSPDGATLLITVQTNQAFTLWTLGINDRRMTAFGDVRSIVPAEAAFSPDGRWIAYHSRASATDQGIQVFLQPFPSTGAKYLVPQVGGHPYWIPKSDELILNTSPGSSASIAVTTTPHVVFGNPVAFSRVGRSEPNPSTSRRAADIMPDGERVIGVTSLAGPSQLGSLSQIFVVLNWFDDVRQRVPVK